MPDLRDPNFFRTVVLLLEHGDQGSLGLVLNRPTGADIGEALPNWAKLTSAPACFYRGGPVEPSAVIGLARRARGGPEPERWAPVLQDVGVVDLRSDPRGSIDVLEHLRVFNGYAGWGAAQLEGELTAGGWLVTDAEPDDPFTAAPDALWHSALHRPPNAPSWIVGHRAPRISN